MEAALRGLLAATPLGDDETLVEYVVSAALAQPDAALAELDASLSPILVEYGAVASAADARELLRKAYDAAHPGRGEGDSGSVPARAPAPSAKARPAAAAAAQGGSGAAQGKAASALAAADDDWGTRSLPVVSVTNTVVERIESAQERARRERKEQKALQREEAAAKRDMEQFERERAAGVLTQVTASAGASSALPLGAAGAGGAASDGADAGGAGAGGQPFAGDIHLPHISVSVGSGVALIDDAALRLTRGSRNALLARNGAGKSTLLSRIARREVPNLPASISILYVAQEVAGSDDTPVNVVLKADATLQHLLRMQKATTDPSALAGIQSQLSQIDADSAEPRARALLTQLDFSKEMQDRPTKDLSGGWRMRASLASAMFAPPDLLLLDEPTNGLSLPAIVALEDYLKNRLPPHTILLVVSHDRVFLNNVVDHVIILKDRKLETFRGDLDTYERVSSQRATQMTRERDAQLGKIAHMQKFVDRFRYNAKRASLAQSRLKAIARIEATMTAEVVEDPETVLSFPAIPVEDLGGSVSSDVFLLRAEQLAFRYGPDTPLLFSGVDFDVCAGERKIIAGENGKGKTSLLKLLAGETTPTEGVVRKRPNVRVAFFKQHAVDALDVRRTPLEFMIEKFGTGTRVEDVRPHLARYGVTRELAERRIAMLSGGQKARVALAVLTWTKPHVLLMDEPTSHLDLETCDALMRALLEFNGGVVIVSHDQTLMQTVGDELWVLKKGQMKKWEGDFEGFKRGLLS